MMTLQPANPDRTRIGWIGTGVMGASMCGHLLDAGYSVTLTTRTRSKAEGLLQAGAKWVETPREVAEVSDMVFAIVGYPRDVRQVFADEADGVIAGAKPGCVWVDMTTSEPSLAEELDQLAGQGEMHWLDAPVSGGDRGARAGSLSIMVGGSQEAYQAALPCFEIMGKTIVHQGPAGAGQHTKMVNQTLIATGMIGVCEALLYAHCAGLDLPTVLRSVASGAAGSWSLSNLGLRVIDNDFEPGFYVEHFIKDMGIALSESRKLGLSLPGLALAEQLYQSVAAKGWQRKGTQALQLALAEMSGIDWKNR